ncbi:hypothetical protein CXT76_01720 [Candidatus Parvarchaeota archaeon]|jgi:hypothetical protein|nr:MAG: hypothetical protein CXT76_01720 [Candidatus Parvarchaeota archaeon]HIG51997.1 hypothetical protein [Candidatus Pacearchaeota archaeon]
MNLKFVKSGEKKRLLAELNKSFGISKIDYILIAGGKKKIRGFSGNMTREEIKEFTNLANVEIIGSYFFKKDRFLRLSFDGSHIFKNQLKIGIVNLNEKNLENWMNGKDLILKSEKGVVILKKGDDFFGCGISDGEKIFNYVPRERRIRKS